MKTKLWLLSVALLMTLCEVCFSQTCNNHTVTATITDSASIVWENALYTVTLSNPSGGQKPVCRTTGIPITTTYNGSSNASGALSVSLPDTSLIDPPIQWSFSIQPLASVLPTVMNPVSVTANVSFTTQFSAQAIAPSVLCRDKCYGYTTAEVGSPITIGALFYNTTVGASVPCNLWSSTAWVSCTSGTGFPILVGSGPPVATCALSNVGQQYIDFTNLIWYACKALPGPTFIWGESTWNGVGASNTPGTNSNWTCLSTATNNTCTWGPIPSSVTPTCVSLATLPATLSGWYNSSYNLYRFAIISGVMSGAIDPTITFNGDSGTHYSTRWMEWSTSILQSGAGSAVGMDLISGSASPTAGTALNGSGELFDPGNATTQKTMTWRGQDAFNSLSSIIDRNVNTMWNNGGTPAAITTITISNGGAGSFTSGQACIIPELL